MSPWEVLIPVSIALGFFVLVGFMTRAIVESRRSRERTKLLSEVHNRLIERMGSAKEFGELLSTQGGAKFMESLGTEPLAAPATPLDRALRAQQTALIASAVGVGLLLVSWTFAITEESQAVCGALGVLTALALSGGIGSWLSARTTLRLSQRCGLISPVPGADR
jgi:hypothetical protein